MNGQTATALADLLYADRELIGMYEDASARLSPDTAVLLKEAIDDHQRHEALLSEAVDSIEMQLAEPSEDMQLLMEEHRHRVRMARDERDVLDVLILAERLNALLYEKAEMQDLPEELSEVITEQHADERLNVELIAERAPELSAQSEHGVACMTGMTDDINPDDFD